MRIKVNHESCQGHARCNALAPAIFELDDTGYIVAGDIDVPAGGEVLARRAARACPERALTVIDDTNAG